ncbi:RloB family protein [Nocardia sp. CDC159]|uniref:RloB family protein n=1 Tax=Nocardia pulmonis TaxID=2951408 RepID=A0A9X2IY02_9NOCA|nr:MULTISPECIES: RloB family protein [Nocardia]MCM6773381.1 RloB family protein [Nocardia pulmonis]MCM6786268.1 RloB family protein [Nocardia sp. CDC159]
MVIFCEGINTEHDYLRAVKNLPAVRANTSIRIELDPEQGAPLTLVRRAVTRLQDSEIDECWCVFDVEWPQHHPHLRDAVQLARAHGIGLAVSNPCFELWLILHHREHNAFIDTASAERDSRRRDGRDGKHIEAAIYMPLRAVAARRAAVLAERHTRNGSTIPHDNPSSSMYELLSALEPS